MTRARNLANLANVDTFTVDSSDRVGLGTTNPGATLQITADTPGIIFEDQNSGYTESKIEGSSGHLYFTTANTNRDHIFNATGGSESVRITGDGNLGIGVTDPDSKLESVSSSTDGVNAHLGGQYTDNGTVAIRRIEFSTKNFRNAIQSQQGSGGNNFSSDNDLLLNPSGGSVGIGTNNPQAKIHLKSAATTAGWQIRTDSVGLNNESGFYRDASDHYEMVLRNGLGGLSYIKNNGGASTANLIFHVQGSERARIDSGGRLLRGVTSFSAGAAAVFAGNSSVASGNGVIFINRGTNNALNGGDGIGNIEFGNNAGNVFARISAEAGATSGTSGSGDYPGQLKFWTTADGGSAPTQRAIITKDGNFGINAPSPNGRVNIFTNSNEHALRIDQNHTSALVQFLEVESTSYSGDGIKFHYFRGATSANNFIACDSNHGGTPDREFTFRGDGNAYADGTWNNNGADYAEFFESTTGNAIPVGTTVVLENNKVRAATSSDSVSSIIGVIRPKEPGQASMTIGNSAWNKWSNKYLTDDFDRFILDEHVVYEWTETVEDGDDIFHSYESHQIPEGVTVPSDVVGQTHDAKGNRFTHYRLNPDFDPSLTYVPREERDEWVIVGLVGQVKILDGQPMNDRWIKMRDVSDTVEEWFIR